MTQTTRPSDTPADTPTGAPTDTPTGAPTDAPADAPRDEVVVVSACLLGRACRYDGQSKGQVDVEQWCDDQRAAGRRVVPVCPEELGELGTPRPAAELQGGDGARVWSEAADVREVVSGRDVTSAFKRGAERALQLAPDVGVAVLKARSPSCGVGRTNIDGAVQRGDGVFAALLRARGVALHTDESLLVAIATETSNT